MNYNEAPHPNYSRPERLDKKNNSKDYKDWSTLAKIAFVESWLKNLDENTITKLEEKENDNMKENTKIMNIFEACEYVKEHTDEYLVQRYNERFTLHSDGKKVYTKYKKDDDGIIEKIVELDNATMCSEWVKGEKIHTYVFTGYINNGLVHISQECLKINDIPAHRSEIEKKLHEIAHKNFDAHGGYGNHVVLTLPYKVRVECSMLYDENLNPIVSMNA